MQFIPEVYFHNLTDLESSIKIRDYNSCFREGILICPNLLFLFVKGAYYESITKRSGLSMTEREKIQYGALTQLLDYVKKKIGGAFKIFITAHIFTKFMYLLHKDNSNDEHKKKIIKLFYEEFKYISEEEVKREEILDSEVFKNKLYGISETVLLILKSRKSLPCILATSGKISAEYREDFLLIRFEDIVSFVESEKRKNRI